MKKAIISLGAILFSGVLLASCSSTKTLSRPSKGKAVDKVNLNDVEINKNDKYEDVIEKIGPSHYINVYTKDASYGLEVVNNYKSSGKSQNYISSSLGETGYTYRVYASNSSKSSSSQYIDAYSKYEDGKTTSFFESTNKSSGNTKASDYTGSYTINEKHGYAGTRAEDSNSCSVDAGKYDIRKSKNKNNLPGSTTEDEDKEVYQYLDKTEKKSDSNYDATYGGKDDKGNYYSYNITSFGFSGDYHTSVDFDPFHQYSYRAPSPWVQQLNGEYEDLYKGSFELTNKYIILKIKLDFTESMYRYADRELYYEGTDSDDANIAKKLKQFKDNEYKGSYAQYEIWLSYEDELRGFAYYSSKEVTKANINKEITREYLVKNKVDPDEYSSYIGKKYISKGTSEYIYQAKYNNKNYDSKINKLKDKCKKNNIFDKIDMTIVGV